MRRESGRRCRSHLRGVGWKGHRRSAHWLSQSDQTRHAPDVSSTSHSSASSRSMSFARISSSAPECVRDGGAMNAGRVEANDRRTRPAATGSEAVRVERAGDSDVEDRATSRRAGREARRLNMTMTGEGIDRRASRKWALTERGIGRCVRPKFGLARSREKEGQPDPPTSSSRSNSILLFSAHLGQLRIPVVVCYFCLDRPPRSTTRRRCRPSTRRSGACCSCPRAAPRTASSRQASLSRSSSSACSPSTSSSSADHVPQSALMLLGLAAIFSSRPRAFTCSTASPIGRAASAGRPALATLSWVGPFRLAE